MAAPASPAFLLSARPLSGCDSLVAAAEVADLAAVEALAFALPAEDEARIVRHVHAGDRAARRAAWRLARGLAGLELGRPPEALAVVRDGKGRPHLADGCGLDINLSHSGGWVAVGLARGGRIGVDVELPRPLALWRDIARSFLGDVDLALWAALPAEAQAAAALSAWCRKEAVLKATGEGLAADPRTLEVPVAPPAATGTAILDRGGRRLSVMALELPAPDASASASAATCLAVAVEDARLPRLLALGPGGAWRSIGCA